MDTFTTTFSLPYPSPAPHTSSLAAIGGLKSNRAAGQYDPNTSYDDTATLPSLTTSSSTRSLGSLREHEHEHEAGDDEGDKEKEGQVMQQLCREIAAREGCVVTAIANQDDALGFADSPKHTQRTIDSAAPATTTTWSFCIAGTQAAVLAAKGAVLREMPRDHSTTILAKCADILVSPYRYNSSLKPAVKARLDSIASTTDATICIPSGHTSGMYLYRSGTHASSTGNDDVKSDTVPATPVLHPSQLAHGVRHVTSGSAGSLNMGMGRSFVQHRRSVSSIGQSTSASHRSYGSIESLVPVSADPSFEAMDDSMPYTGQLEKETACEIVIGGSEGSVGAAKVGVLVMLDEMVRLGRPLREYSRPGTAQLTLSLAFTPSQLPLSIPSSPSSPGAAVSSCKTSRKRHPPTSISLLHPLALAMWRRSLSVISLLLRPSRLADLLCLLPHPSCRLLLVLISAPRTTPLVHRDSAIKRRLRCNSTGSIDLRLTSHTTRILTHIRITPQMTPVPVTTNPRFITRRSTRKHRRSSLLPRTPGLHRGCTAHLRLLPLVLARWAIPAGPPTLTPTRTPPRFRAAMAKATAMAEVATRLPRTCSIAPSRPRRCHCTRRAAPVRRLRECIGSDPRCCPWCRPTGVCNRFRQSQVTWSRMARKALEVTRMMKAF